MKTVKLLKKELRQNSMSNDRLSARIDNRLNANDDA